MLLGDLLSQVEQAGANGNAAAILDDVALIARVAAMAGQIATDPDDYVLAAVRRFEHSADDSDWVSLIGAAARSDEPGKACLRRMVEHALDIDEASV